MEGEPAVPREIREKPTVLYHGSPHKTLEELEPRTSGSDEELGSLVYASPDLTMAVMFTAEVRGNWSAGRSKDVPYALISEPRESFLEHDKGGTVYVLPSTTFRPHKLGEDMPLEAQWEWHSDTRVRPIKKMEFDSSLQAMLNHGVQVYFIDEKILQLHRKSPQTAIETLAKLQSENQRAGINVKPLL